MQKFCKMKPHTNVWFSIFSNQVRSRSGAAGTAAYGVLPGLMNCLVIAARTQERSVSPALFATAALCAATTWQNTHAAI